MLYDLYSTFLIYFCNDTKGKDFNFSIVIHSYALICSFTPVADQASCLTQTRMHIFVEPYFGWVAYGCKSHTLITNYALVRYISEPRTPKVTFNQHFWVSVQWGITIFISRQSTTQALKHGDYKLLNSKLAQKEECLQFA